MKTPAIQNKSIKTIKNLLKGIQEAPYNYDCKKEIHLLDRKDFDNLDVPLPYIIFITLVRVLGLEYQFRPHEKTAWTISFAFKGEQYAFEHRKFGLAFISHNTKPSTIQKAKEVIFLINKSIQYIDEFFEPYIDSQVKSGNIAIINKYNRFSDQYMFFRNKANEAFNSQAPLPKKGGIFSSDPLRPDREGSYYSYAMIDSFFSRLETTLILLLAFCDYDPSKDDIKDFIGLNWGSKFKRIFETKKNSKENGYFSKLNIIKEGLRNPLSHGGAEKHHGFILFFFDGCGYLPAYLSKFKDSIHFNLHPIDQSAFDATCKLFDDFDNYLAESKFPFEMEYIKSGLNVRFDRDSIDKIKNEMSSQDDFNDLISLECGIQDINDNMDW